MPHTSLGGDDPDHQLSTDKKDAIERTMRKEARELLRMGKAKERRELENRAANISRRESRKADHH
jgi:hypothetical protein